MCRQAGCLGFAADVSDPAYRSRQCQLSHQYLPCLLHAEPCGIQRRTSGKPSLLRIAAISPALPALQREATLAKVQMDSERRGFRSFVLLAEPVATHGETYACACGYPRGKG